MHYQILTLLLLLLLPHSLHASNQCGSTYTAATLCRNPCPRGVDSECPPGESCFGSITCTHPPPTTPTTTSSSNQCGNSFADARNCAHQCVRGLDADCPSGQRCFASVSCSTPSNPGGGPQIGNYCGPNFTTAAKCETPCPSGTDAECPSGSTCFGAVDCSAGRPQKNQCGLGTDCPLRACCSHFGFCGWTQQFCNDECQSDCEYDVRASGCDESVKASVRFGYYASWSARRTCEPISPQNLRSTTKDYTHLAFSFAFVSPTFELVPSDARDVPMYRQFTALKSSSLKVVIAVGGWAFNDPPTQRRFSNMAATTTSRRRFIDSAIGFMRQYGFDGIDLDWEYPAAPDRGGLPADFDNYVSLIKEMRVVFDAIPDTFSITMAVPLSNWYLRHFDVENLAKYLDFFNVMSYDLHGVWDGNIPSLGPFVKAHTNLTEIRENMKIFYKNNVPASKLVLGMGAYGRTWTLSNPGCTEPGCMFSGAGRPGPCTAAAGFMGLFEIEDRIAAGRGRVEYDRDSASMYLVEGDQWISYDNKDTFLEKKAFADGDCLRGTMVWSVDMHRRDLLPPTGRGRGANGGDATICFA